MTKFTDGPVAGKFLVLVRTPLFLRVAIGPTGEFDALDRLDDTPSADEKLFVYRKISNDGTVLIDGVDRKGRRFGRTVRSATYTLHTSQPDDATARNKTAWEEWARAEYAKLRTEKGSGAGG